MTDLEINKALALAIGHKEVYGWVTDECKVWWQDGWKDFDYRDWNVIGPIAAKYNCFPTRYTGRWYVKTKLAVIEADTPQKAIVAAVIGAKK